MNTIIANPDSSAIASVVAGIIPIPQTQAELEEAALQIEVPAFDLRLTAPLLDVEPLFESGRASIRVLIDEQVTALITLKGKLIENGRKFQTEEVGWRIELEERNTRAEFVASTLQAALSLARNVRFQFPQPEFNYELNFESSLLKITRMMQRRHTAFRVLVIERATSREFSLPEDFSGQEIETISFLYHAIMERHCLWPLDGTVTIFIPATQESQEWWSLSQQPARYQFPPTLTSRVLLGQEISLGHETVIIEDGIVEDRDRIVQEMSSNDGHNVEVKFRSLTGQIRYELPEAPRLPVAAWDPIIQKLIDLEEKLALELAARYHALAASTLANLTEEEKAEITSRPELGEDAYLMAD
jgi:hypothetical protein